MRIKEQYVWNFLFALFFLSLVVDGVLLIEEVGYGSPAFVTPFQFIILALASFRLTRLVLSDKITAFFRDQFFDEVEGKLVKPPRGPRRTLADLVTCPWCLGLWSAASVTFFFLLTPYSWFPILFLAVAALAAPLQFLSSLLANKADLSRRELDS